MLKILQKFNIRNFKRIIIEIFHRFALSATISLAAFVLMLVLVRFEDALSRSTEEIILKAFITLAITFFFSIALYIYSEGRQHAKPKKLYFQFLSFVFGLLFYYFFDEGLFSGDQVETVVYIILSIIGVISFVFIAKYFKKFIVKADDQDEFYVSSYVLVLKVIMSGIVGIASMLLGFLALSSVFTLFDIEFVEEGKWYGYWATFSLVLLAPYYFLANLPTAEESDAKNIEKISSNKFYSFLINYVGLPAIFIYFVILYAYTVKVLMNFSEWPQGEVSWMVILFSFFGYIIYFASYAFRNIMKHAAAFRKILPIAVILQTPMLFYAIGLRINQYDFTINRYLVTVFGLWLLFLSAYYIFSKAKNFSISFYSLLVVVIFMSIGPWSVYVVPEWRQLVRLEKHLKQANILQGTEIQPLENYSDIDKELSKEIYGGIEYLSNFHGYETLKKIFANEIKEIEQEDQEEFEKNRKERLERLNDEKASEEIIKDIEEEVYNGINNWELVNKLSEFIKVRKWSDTSQDTKPRYLRFENADRYNFDSSIEISGYDYYVALSQNNNIKIDEMKMEERYLWENKYRAEVSAQEAKLILYFGEEALETIDIQESIINRILNNKENYLEPEYEDWNLTALLENEDMSFEISGEQYEMLVVFRSISIPNPDWTEEMATESDEMNEKFMPREISTIFPYAQGYVLIKEKVKYITE
jgi:hypothetical protein